MQKILILNGPNLNYLGRRETSIYGKDTLADIETAGNTLAKTLGIELTWIQSNHQGVLIDEIQGANENFDGLIINPAGYGHTSVALRDALLCVEIPIIEVHLSNPSRREAFRQQSLTADVALGQICGLGPQVYQLAIRGMAHQLHH
ncbi:MAG: type II 3-dehydroquinate dehydratase [Myxococcota bacterium]|nr:type II 3-dehydroquinate dehydratase [Myxococcota bacterium]